MCCLWRRCHPRSLHRPALQSPLALLPCCAGLPALSSLRQCALKVTYYCRCLSPAVPACRCSILVSTIDNPPDPYVTNVTGTTCTVGTYCTVLYQLLYTSLAISWDNTGSTPPTGMAFTNAPSATFANLSGIPTAAVSCIARMARTRTRLESQRQCRGWRRASSYTSDWAVWRSCCGRARCWHAGPWLRQCQSLSKSESGSRCGTYIARTPAGAAAATADAAARGPRSIASPQELAPACPRLLTLSLPTSRC